MIDHFLCLVWRDIDVLSDLDGLLKLMRAVNRLMQNSFVNASTRNA